MTRDVRILLLADSHLGFDLPAHARTSRRRRGHDFLANYRTALRPALAGEVDLVVHAGDVFDRANVLPSVAYQAFEPLLRVAELGVPVFVVPGNHERARIPHPRFALHSRIHVFDRARTFVANVGHTTLALSGFPYERRDVRTNVVERLDQTGWRDERAAIRLLCLHHCFEGATVGPADFTFTTASDVIRARDVPENFAAVFTGHIHRHQVLTHDLSRRSLNTPVLYPGSIERTSFAEKDEAKGFMIVHVAESERDVDVRWEFRRLPARPMIATDVDADRFDPRELRSAIESIVATAPDDAIVSIRVSGQMSDAHWRAVKPSHLRELVPDTMNVEIRPAGGFDRSPSSRPAQSTAPDSQLALSFG